ncbi:hypothetical protein M3Y99_01655500 [Aphelenchoides fujianensis]|nr:hypothetical protein M3Y99_01655500 [Aphelenchoides fujianensis]
MARDIPDILPASPNCVLLVCDRFDVLKGLVRCSGDVEAGSFEPLDSQPDFKSYELPLNTAYYSTRVRIVSFPTIENYAAFINQVPNAKDPLPMMILLCLDATVSNEEFKEQCERIRKIQSGILFVHNRAFLVHGTIPDLGAHEHPKMRLLTQLVLDLKAEMVLFDPNEVELEELQENKEKFGVERAWELLENVGQDWPSLVLHEEPPKGDVEKMIREFGRGGGSLGALLGVRRTPAVQQATLIEEELNENEWIEKERPPLREPTAEEEAEIFKWINGRVQIPPPEAVHPMVSVEALPFLQKQRAQYNARLTSTYEQHRPPFSFNPAPVHTKPSPLLSTETTLFCGSQQQTALSIVNTNENLQSDERQRNAAIISNLIPLAISEGGPKKKKKKPKKKRPADEDDRLADKLDEKVQETSDETNQLKAKYEELYEHVQKSGKKDELKDGDRDLNALVENWKHVKDGPPNDELIIVATKLTEAVIGSPSGSGRAETREKPPASSRLPKKQNPFVAESKKDQ